MPKTGLHTLMGAAVGAGYYTLDRGLRGEKTDPERLAEVFMLGGLAGTLPDLLEPPLNRFHRKFFHSFTTLGATAASLGAIDAADTMDGEQKAFYKSLVVAYMSHLAMDSRTPMGLPLLF